jgi:hypothetical protein
LPNLYQPCTPFYLYFSQTDSLDSSNVEIFCFRQLLEYVIENFKSYRPLLVSSLHLKYKNCVDRSIQDFLLCKMEECKAFAKSVPTLYTILLVLFLGGL